MKRFLVQLQLLLFIPTLVLAKESLPKFVENKGQFPDKVEYSLRLANADLFFEKNALVFNFFNPELIHQHQHDSESGPSDYAGHAYRISFEGSNRNALVQGVGETYPDRMNFIRKDVQVSNVNSFTQLMYEDVYDGIDLHYYSSDDNFKYDVIADAGAEVNQFRMKYEGHSSIKLKNGRLIVKNEFNTVSEFIPLAYQVLNGKQVAVKCEYVLEDETVSFHFPDGYDDTKELVIDPTLIFSSYTGSTSNNFGFTATYDLNGALYGGGIAFGAGYPTVLGAYSETFSGLVDMAISKFSPDGTTLEYSTYIGGASSEAPHSMIVNSQGELVILGSTSSLDFPTTTSAFDTDFNGGNTVNYASNGMDFENGSDIVVVVLNSDGTDLVGSTYFGGSQNDGLNEDGTLSYNYGDIFRGEVIVDAADNIYVASSTASADFPVTPGAIDGTFSGSQDACLAKFNADVSALEWCTYVGGNQADAGYSMKLNAAEEVYLAGGTSSSDLSVDASAVFPSYQGGSADGFLYHFSNDGTSLINSSYLGTSSYDQTYFVEVDDDNDVYVYGQSTGNYPVTSGTYANVNGKQFIQKLSPDLTTSIYSTTIGSGSSTVNISPTAFLVDICERVFISGWGGGTNNSWNGATGNTNGLPVTSDGEQQTTDGSDFYFMVLEEDASAILYGSFFGGDGIQEHVDGGTSRFNENGVIHQAACAGCGGSNLFPTTPGVVSQINGNSCNLGVVKLDLEISVVQVDIDVSGEVQGCAPFEVDFQADLINAADFIWYFGDGDSSDLENPQHVYELPGTYEALLIGTDTSSCTGEAFVDTAFIDVTVSVLPQEAEAGPNAELCPGESVQIGEAEVAGLTYSWTPTAGLSNPNVAQPSASPMEDTQYFLTISNVDNCESTDSVVVTMFRTEAFPDTTVCVNDSIQVFAVGGSSFSWQPTVGVSNPNIADPFITGGFATEYTVFASNGSCEDSAAVTLETLPAPTALFDVSLSQSCEGDSVTFINLTEGADEYVWNIDAFTTSEFQPTLLFEPGEEPIVTLTAINSLGECSDSVTVDFSDGWFTEDSVLFKMPNVITPNGDDVNDCFRPDFEGDLDDCFTLKVFSRWGRLLFDSEKEGETCWDGTQRTGGLVAEGTYYYIANIRGTDHAGYLTVLYE